MMNKLKSVFFLAFIAFISFSCKQEPITIGLLMADYDTERWEKDRDDFIEATERLGAKVLVEVANNDLEKQVEQAGMLLEKGVKALVIVPVDSEKSGQIIEMAHEKGVKVISYDRLIKGCELDFYLSFDNMKVGELQADYLTKQAPEGKYIIIGGPISDNNSLMISIGQNNILSPFIDNNSIEIIYNVHASDWSKESGYENMKKCFNQHGTEGIVAVLAANDELALGVIQAIQEQGLGGKILVSGQDGNDDAKQMIMLGLQTMSVYKPTKALATTAAKIAYRFATDKTLEDLVLLHINNETKMVPSMLLPPLQVNKYNIKMNIPTEQYLKDNKITK
jgi:D-xylose transport system substrate-binding protein